MMDATAIDNEMVARWLDTLDRGHTLDDDHAGGYVYIDRLLPYLCVACCPADAILARLVATQAAYAWVDTDTGHADDLRRDLQAWSRNAAERFGAFVVVELWETPGHDGASARDSRTLRPGFRILAPDTDVLAPLVECLTRCLERIEIHKQAANVDVTYTTGPAPPGSEPLLSNTEIPVYVVGLELDPIYRDAYGTVFPFLLESFRAELDAAVKHGLTQFVRTRTSLDVPGHLALGRRALDRTAVEVDHELALIDGSFDFLLQTTPLNARHAWQRFEASGFDEEPVFYYRPLNVDPELLKRRLFALPLDEVADPSFNRLFREKAEELDRKLTMLRERDTRQFFYGSLQLFGEVSPGLLSLAQEILHRIPRRDDTFPADGSLDAKAFAEAARPEFAYYRSKVSAFPDRAEIRSDMPPSLMVSKGQLLIGAGIQVPRARANALLQHEIGTHMLTYYNGQAQPFRLMATGLAGYESLQEGLAVLAEFLVGGLTVPRLRVLAARVVAAQCLIEDASFIDVFRLLTRAHDFAPYTAFSITMRTFRGGGFVKDVIYLRGLHELLAVLRDGEPIERLYSGKIALAHRHLLDELEQRGALRPMPLRPRFLQTQDAQNGLERVRSGLTFIDLAERQLS